MKKSTTKRLPIFLEKTSNVEIAFEVEVPQELEQDTIWISGNLDVLGSWNGKGLALKKVAPRLYRGEAPIPQGSLVFYKVTRGSWDQVEVDKNGFDIEDRTFIAKESRKIHIKVESFAEFGARAHPSTKDEHVQDLGFFGEKTTGIGRKVEIHLPPNYATEPQSYPVIYMLDGQNLFDAATAFMGQEWAADKIHDQLFYEGLIEPFIIVGIHNTHLRHDFYTPVPDPYLGEGGKLHLLEKMIREEIEPVLVSDFRIRRGPKNTGIIGSSLGGLAAFHLGWRHPDRYGLIGAMSPSLWWNQYYTYDMVQEDDGKDEIRRQNLKIWLDMGTRESQYMHRPLIAVSRLAYLLRKKKFNVQLYIDKDATHSERAWRKRLPEVFQWLLGKSL
ncbi:MAG: hypothetical protein D6785_07215 [Planctomycetota bacterium]|nr:MAG: hypothetical protein D6785_07215 [Planctomycetota bacterium]